MKGVELVYYSLREKENVLGISFNYVAWYSAIKSYSFTIILNVSFKIKYSGGT